MTIYVAVCQDRHIDPVVATFTDRDAAVEYAHSFMLGHMAHPEGITTNRVPGRVANFGYKYESDNAYVVKTELDQP